MPPSAILVNAVLATFSADVADRHPPTAPGEAEDGTHVRGREGVRLLTWGDPLLTAWLEAIRGNAVGDDVYRLAAVNRDTNPLSGVTLVQHIV